MRLFNILSKNFIFFIVPVSLLLASCGSYQYSGYESDGIYGETNRGGERSYDRQNQNATTQDNTGSYYQNLFAEEAALYGEIADGTIFTDVDSYTSTGDYSQEDLEAGTYRSGHAPWGNAPDSYSINIYNNGFGAGFFNPFWGGGMYGFDPFWGPGMWGPGMYGGMWGPGMWGPGMYGGMWGRGMFGGGMWGNHWGMGFGGFGFGMGFGHPFIGGGWYNPYNFYGNRNFRQNVAYNVGRRDASPYYGNRNSSNAVRNSSAINNPRGRNSSYSRSIRTLRNSNDVRATGRAQGNQYGTGMRRTTDYNTARRSSMDIRNGNPNSTYSRSQMPERSSGTMRTTTSQRSSGAVRSSGGGVRSSGGATRSSGGGSSRGRGN